MQNAIIHIGISVLFFIALGGFLTLIFTMFDAIESNEENFADALDSDKDIIRILKDSGIGKVYHSIRIPSESGKELLIDELMVSKLGLFVINNKDDHERIVGNTNDNY